MIDLTRAAPFIGMHRDATFVIKVGGGSIADDVERNRFAKQVALIRTLGSRVVIVHGGGPQTDRVQRLLGVEPRKVEGRRVTCETGLTALRMATHGDLGGRLVAALGAAGAPALGLCGADADLVVARRREPMATDVGPVDFGLVGDVVHVDPAAVHALLDRDLTPVIAPPAGDGDGGFLNVNADLMAAAIAGAVGAAKLLFVTGAPGILLAGDQPISALCLAELGNLLDDGALTDGMRVKADAIGRAIDGGVGHVHVVSGEGDDAIIRELYTTEGSGTMVTATPQQLPLEASTT